MQMIRYYSDVRDIMLSRPGSVLVSRDCDGQWGVNKGKKTYFICFSGKDIARVDGRVAVEVMDSSWGEVSDDKFTPFPVSRDLRPPKMPISQYT